MDLLEYQGKQLFRKHEVPVPEGRHAASVKEAVEAAEELGFPVPVVVRLDGTNDEEGRRLPAEAKLPGVHTEATMLGAAERVVGPAG